MEGYRRADPPPVPQLEVPIAIPNACFKQAVSSSKPQIEATGHLILIAFYYLLGVGEYTKPKVIMCNGKKVHVTRTIQFTVGNVCFYKEGKVIPRASSLNYLLTCDAETLKITNQKNGRMGSTIHQKTNGKTCCPIKTLAHRVKHVLNNGGDSNTLLCNYFQNKSWHAITSHNIIMRVRAT